MSHTLVSHTQNQRGSHLILSLPLSNYLYRCVCVVTYAGGIVGGSKDEFRSSVVAGADVGHVWLSPNKLLSTEHTHTHFKTQKCCMCLCFLVRKSPDYSLLALPCPTSGPAPLMPWALPLFPGSSYLPKSQSLRTPPSGSSSRF